jgi:hypothetical protein
MKVEALTQVDRELARELWQKYQTHKHYQTPADAEIAAIYKRIAQGKTVIRALASIVSAGLNTEGLPKLAIARADQARAYVSADGPNAVFAHERIWGRSRNESRSKIVRVPWEGFKLPGQNKWHYEAQVPIIPVHLRPRRGIQNYHILWEAEWTKRYPVDPYLLRRFGGDAWLVVAAWDLTEVERAVMSSRLTS